MAAKQALQSLPTAPEQPQGDSDVPLRPFQVGEPIPRRMNALDMRKAFPVNGHVMSVSAFYANEAAGRFERFELKPKVGAKAWSGTLVTRYLDCESGASRFVTIAGGKRA